MFKLVEYTITISNPKTGKSYNKKVDVDVFEGKRINDKIDGSSIELEGYELKITGGSDKCGFPMRLDLQGASRRKILSVKSKGMHIANKGIRKRKNVAGNQIGNSIAQINLSILKNGSKDIEEILGSKKEEVKEEAK